MLSALRAATAPLHGQLEARLDVGRRLGSHAGYAGLLATMLGAVAPLEAALDRFDWAGAGLDAAVARWRTPLIEADLRHLGLSDAAIAALPRSGELSAASRSGGLATASRGGDPATAPPGALPPLPSRDAAFGALYVLEGSALGGQLILRQAREALGVEPGAGASFYGAHGRPPVGEGWRAFRAALERHCADVPAAAAAAAGSFRLLGDWAAATLRPAPDTVSPGGPPGAPPGTPPGAAGARVAAA